MVAATGRRVAGPLLLAAVAVVGALLVSQHVAHHGTNTLLLSVRMAEKAIRAQQGLDDYWHSLDKRADRTARKIVELHHIRYQSGVGTRFKSDEARRDLRSSGDWGKDGADKHGSVLATEHGRRGFKNVRANSLRDVSAAFFRNAQKHPLAARKALEEEVQEMASDYYAHRRKGARINAEKARIEQLADAATLGTKGTNDLVGREMMREANKGLFGSSLTGLVRNVFGGPKSSIYQYSSQHHAKTGKYHWSALGEPHWDANGDPIVPKADPNEKGLASAGVKMTNSLKELYEDVDTTKDKQVSGKGEMHLVRLMDNLLYGKRVNHPVPLDLRAEHKKEVANYSRELAEHKFDNKMLVDKKSSFFSDDEDESADEPNAGLVTKMLEPEAETKVADKSPVAKKLFDDEMIVSGDKGFFKDTNDENPMDRIISSEDAQQEHPESKDTVMAREKRIQQNTQVRKLEHKRVAEAAKRGAEDVKDFKVVHAVAQKGLAHERSYENHRLANSQDEYKFFGGVNDQSGRITAIKQPYQVKSDLLAQAEQSVVGAEKREQAENRKVRSDELRAEVERQQVARIERQEERKGIEQAAREAKAEQAAKDQRVIRDEISTEKKQDRARTVIVATPKARAFKGEQLEARDVPAKSGKEVELHVSGKEERHVVADYFENLEKEDDYKHKLAVSVIHKEERPHVKMHAHADGTDRRDTKRDDKFFDKIAQHDMAKSKHARELRLQHEKDENSLNFYEAVDRQLAREKAEDKRKAKSEVPKAYEEWQHAEHAMGVEKFSKSVASKVKLQQPAVRAARSVRAGATRKAQPAARTANKGIKAAMGQAADSAALQSQIKAAIKSAIQKDVTPQVDEAVASGIKRAMSSKLSTRSTTTESEHFSAPVAEQRTHVASPKGEQVSKVKAPHRNPYDYQKKNLAKVLDTPEPSAKKELDTFLSNPISSVESLF